MPVSERWREQGPRLAVESIGVVACVVLALAVLEWRQDAELEERRERPTETISSEPPHDVRAFHDRLAGTRLALSKTSAESVEPGVRPEGLARPGELVWIAGSLAVLLACQSEPVVGPEAEAVPVAPHDAPSSGQPSTPVADTYVADGGDRHENFAADTFLLVERSGDRRVLARWDLDAIAAIPYREGWLLRKADDEAMGSVAFGSRESGAAPGLVLTTEGQECELASPPDSLPRAYYVENNLVQNPVCSKARFWGHLVIVIFVDGTSQAEREEAIELVSGTVVGGVPLSEQGIYVVRVEDDESGSGVCEAVSTLKELPQVKVAGPDTEVGYP